MAARTCPLNFRLQGRLCVVVGGGAVGRRKVAALLAAGARVRLIDPHAAPAPAGVEWLARPYRDGDLADAALAVAATDDPAVDAAVAAEARARRLPVNVAADPAAGDFFFPAVLRRGALTVAVASDGASPALAGALRDLLAASLGPEWGTLAEIAAALRQKRLTLSAANAYDSEVLRRLLEGGLPGLLAAGDAAGVDRLLTQQLGAGATLAALGVTLPKGVP